MPRLSVIIAAVDGPERLERGLATVLRHLPRDSEVVVVLSDHYDDPYRLDGEVRFVEMFGADLIECFQAGISVTSSAVVHLLAAGAEVSEGWADRALVHFEDPRVAAVAPLLRYPQPSDPCWTSGVRFSRGGACGIAGWPTSADPPERASRAIAVLGPHLQAAFYRRRSLASLGGLPAELGADLAAVDIALAIQQAGWRAVCEPASRIALDEPVRKNFGGFRHGMQAEQVFWRNLAHLGYLQATLLHPLSVLAECLQIPSLLRAPAHMLGHLLAGVTAANHRNRQAELRKLATSQAALSTTPDAVGFAHHDVTRNDRSQSGGSQAPLRRAA